MRSNPAIKARLRELVFAEIPLYDSEGIILAQGAWIDLTRRVEISTYGAIRELVQSSIHGRPRAFPRIIDHIAIDSYDVAKVNDVAKVKRSMVRFDESFSRVSKVLETAKNFDGLRVPLMAIEPQVVVNIKWDWLTGPRPGRRGP